MANDNHASYSRIGFIVLLGIAAIIGTLVYLGGFGSKKNILMAETYFATQVTGLSVGSAVEFRGVKVGSVSDITFIGSEYEDADEKDWQTILVRIAYDIRTFRLNDQESPEETIEYLIQKGIRATVSSSGVTGLSKLELNFPKDPAPISPLSWRPKYPCIPPQPSMLESVSDSLSKVMSQLDKMEFASAWSNLSTIAESAADICQNVNAFIESQRAGLSETIEGAGKAVRNFRSLVDEVKANPSRLFFDDDPEPLPETER